METLDINAMIQSREGFSFSFFNADVQEAINNFKVSENRNGIGQIAKDLKELYRKLRQDLNENSTWSYSKRCHRWARHFYDLAKCLYKHFNRYHVLVSVEECIELCLKLLDNVSILEASDELKDDAEIFRELIKAKSLTNSNQEISMEYENGLRIMESLKVINTLEYNWTVNQENPLRAEIHCCHLVQYYKLVGEEELAEQTIIIHILSPKQNKPSSPQRIDDIDDIICKEISKNQSSLSKVKSCIEKQFSKPLQSSEREIIQKMYLKHCQKLLLKEVSDCLDEDTTDIRDIQMIFNKMNNLNNLKDFESLDLNPFKDLHYWKLLTKHCHLMANEDEQAFVKDLKTQSWKHIINRSESLKKVVSFLDSFLALLSSSKYRKPVIDQLMLKDYLYSDLTFDKVIDNIKKFYNTEFEELIDLSDLAEETKRFLNEQIKDIVGNYLIHADLKVEDNNILVVKAMHILVSEIFPALEELLVNHPSIEEVRFLASEVMYIDTSLETDAWRGKNIIIITNNLRIVDNVVWDVSGKDSEYTYTTNAGTGCDRHGINGKDGYPGESGGNVVIRANMVECLKQFTIKSNGGRGSTGQDGGDGRDGYDGKGITEYEFKKKLPPVAKYLNSAKEENLKETMDYIEANISSRKRWQDVEDEYIYINGILNDGCEIEFSYEYPRSLNICDAFLLYKGNVGQLGGSAGECGLGGQGGYAGDISIKILEIEQHPNSIITITHNGEQGAHGKGGFFGQHGKNGWDMGYMDHEYTKFFCDEWPKYYGSGEKSKISLETSDTNDRNHVKFPYKNTYVTMITSKNEHTKLQKKEQRQNIRQNNDLQHHARAQRKKNILESTIRASSSPISDQLRALRSEFESSRQQASEALSDNQKQERSTSQKQELKWTRVLARNYANISNNIKKRMNKESTDANKTDKQTINFDDMIVELAGDTSLERWSGLNIIELDLKTVTQLFLKLETMRIGNPQQLLHVESLLNDKYRFAILQEISKLLRNKMHAKQDDIQFGLEPENVAKYLTISNEKSTAEIGKYLSKDNVFEIKELNDSNIRERVLREFLNEVKDPALEGLPHKDLYTKFDNHIKKNGLLSKSYRQLLAIIFQINIRVYVKNEANRLKLVDSCNSNERNPYYLVNINDEFKELNINENYIQLDEHCRRTEHILRETDMFRNRIQLVDYFSQKTFLNDLYFERFPEEEFPADESNQPVQAIMQYFTNEKASEQLQLETKLKLITLPSVGNQRIINTVVKRFAIEGRTVSIHEFNCLINSISEATINKWNNKSNIFCWIISAHSQIEWLAELILLQIQNHFQNLVDPKLIDHLSRVRQADILLLFFVKFANESVSMQCIMDIFYLLSEISNRTINNLDELVLSEWPLALKYEFWQRWVQKLAINWPTGSYEKASHYLFSIDNTYGTQVTIKLMEILVKNKGKLTHQIVEEILTNFYNETWSLTEQELKILGDHCLIEQWMEDMHDKCAHRNLEQLINLTRMNANTTQTIANELTDIQKSIEMCNSPSNLSKEQINLWAKSFKKNEVYKNINFCTGTIVKMLQFIDRGIELTKGFRLRDTQKLAILCLLTNKKRTLAQVSTGEGKSLIVVALSVVMALFGEKVDIITSSSVLARRDAECNRDLYDLFSVHASHNCSELIEKRKDVYSSNEVIYGDISSFQRDYLLDTFYGKNIIGDRSLDNLIVDEVDSMLLDKGSNMLYLSHNLPHFDKLQSVYIFIWQLVNPLVPSSTTLCDKKAIAHDVLKQLYDLIDVQDIRTIDLELSEEEIKTLWNSLIGAGVLGNRGELLKESVSFDQLPQGLRHTVDALNYLFWKCRQRIKAISVPKQMMPFIEEHLDAWIGNAIEAFLMNPGEDYVVDVDRTGTSAELDPNIIILDRDTGTDQCNSEWEEGLHQFLQLKHGCKISLQSLKAVFISNVSYFRCYRTLYGLTGTLGSQSERDLLSQIYGAEFVTVPTAEPKKFVEEMPILCSTKNDWITTILEQAEIKTKEDNRSVLIICKTVKDAETFYNAFQEKHTENVHYTYTRDHEEVAIIKDELEPGQTIISTNIAGRGTDIKLSEELKEAGGLHVCLSYLPKNLRIEQQAFGRAARNGEKGSGQLIIWNPKGQKSVISMLKMKEERDVEELYRISYLRAHFDNQITCEEECFGKFQCYYKSLKAKLAEKEKKIASDLQQILLGSFLDKWTFWLDEHCKFINKITDEDGKRKLATMLNEFLKKYIEVNEETWLTCIEGNLTAMTRYGKYLMEHKKIPKAIGLFDRIIESEPHFSEAAHYYKGCAMLKENQNNKMGAKEEFREAAKLFENQTQIAIFEASWVGTMKNPLNSIIQIDGFKKQQEQKFKLYSIFSESIDRNIGRTVESQDFNNVTRNEFNAKIIFDQLLQLGALNGPRLRKYVSLEELESICFDYCIPAKLLCDFLERNDNWLDEKQLFNDLREAIKLPNRRDFWQELLTKEVLTNQVEYVTIDMAKLSKIDSQKFDVDSIEVQILDPENSEGAIFFDLEWLEHNKKNKVYRKDDITRIAGTNYYEALVDWGIISENRKANLENCENSLVRFSSFDSISPEDFERVNISQTEAHQILKQLVETNVLVKGETNEYRLAMNIRESSQLFSFATVYHDAVKSLLGVCFSYRIAFQNLLAKVPLNIEYEKRYSHRNLITALINNKILDPIEVTIGDYNADGKQFYDLLKNECTSLASKKSTDNLAKLKLNCFQQLANEDTWQKVVSILKEKRGQLANFKNPTVKLKPLCDQLKGKLDHVENINIFSLNGLDQLLHLGEISWSSAMLWRTTGVAALGTGQLVASGLIELVSLGTLTRGAAVFYYEGISDILFAVSAITSGDLQWSDYGKHKTASLALLIQKAGCASLQTDSGLNQKSLSSNIQYGKVNEQFARKFKRDLAMTVSFFQIEQLIKNCIESIFNSIPKLVDEVIMGLHNNFECFEKAYQNLGGKSATKIINEFINQNLDNKKSESINNSVKSIKKSVNIIMENRPTSIDDFAKAIHSEVECVITSDINELHNILKNKLVEKVSKSKDKHSQDISGDGKENKEKHKHLQLNEVKSGDYESYKKTVNEEWKSFADKIKVKLSELLTDYLQNCFKTYIDDAESDIHHVLAGYKTNENMQESEERRNFYVNSRKLTEIEESTIAKDLERNYYKVLQNLLITAEIPELIACADIIKDIMKNNWNGIAGVTLRVQTDSNIIVKCFSKSTPGTHSIESRNKVITLYLDGNSFDYFNRSTKQVNCPDDNQRITNDWLYNALLSEIPELRYCITPKEFRNKIEDQIRHEAMIKSNEQQGWLALPGLFKDERVQLTENIKVSSDLLLVSDHIVYRFERFFVFGGKKQWVSEKSKVERSNVTTGEARPYENQKKSQGTAFLATQVIIAGALNPKLNKDFQKDLTQDLNQSKVIPSWVNVWNGIGWKIDRYQMNNWKNVDKIDFQANFTKSQATEVTLNEMKGEFLNIIQVEQKSKKYYGIQREVFERTSELITNISAENLFEWGKKGYLSCCQESNDDL